MHTPNLRVFQAPWPRPQPTRCELKGTPWTFPIFTKWGFNPVSDRRNFKTVDNPEYYKQQVEEAFASEHGGFSADVEAEIQKLERCNFLIFSFPLWWFGMPATLKGWVDRVLAYGRVYSHSKIYETGLGQARRLGLVLLTTGSGEKAYSGRGPHPALSALLAPIHHGIFWFNGFQPLTPFVAWSPAHGSDSDRRLVLQRLRERMSQITEEHPVQLPLLADFPEWGTRPQEALHGGHHPQRRAG